MSKTKFINGQTPIQSDFLNKIFGGDPSSSDDATRLGHIHDGGTSDGHVAKINLTSHVTGSVDGSRVKNATLNPSALKSFSNKEDAIQPYATVGSTRQYFINTDLLLSSTGDANLIQLSDGAGELKFVSHSYVRHIDGTSGASLDLGNPSDSNYEGRVNLYHGELNIFANGTYKSSLKSNSSQTSDINYLFPASLGSSNQFLGISSVSGSSTANLGWISGMSSTGTSGLVQLSNGSGGFSASDFSASSSAVSINSGNTGINLELKNAAKSIYENSHSQTTALAHPESFCSLDLSTLTTAVSEVIFGNTITLPFGNFKPGSVVYVQNVGTSGATDFVVNLGYAAIHSLDSQCAYDNFQGTALPSSSQYSGHDATPMMLIGKSLTLPTDTADTVAALAIFSTSDKVVLHSGTGISTLSLKSPKIEVDGGLEIKGSGASQLRLYDSGGTNFVELSALDTVTSSYTLKLPGADGSSGQFLRTDGSGNLTFATVSGSGGGSMSSWTLSADSGSSQSISDGETVDIAGGLGIHTVASSADTVTVSIGYTGSSSLILAATDGTGITVDSTNDKLIIYDDDGAEAKYVRVNQLPTGGMTSFTIEDGSGNTSAITNGDTLNFAATASETTVSVSGDNVTVGLAATAVAAGSYTAADITVDANGRITSAANGSVIESFTIDADNGVPQTIADGDTLTFEGGTGIDIAVSATDKITVALDYSGADSFVMAATNGTGITLDGANDKLVVYDNDAAEVKYINVDQLPSGGAGQTKRSVSVLNTADGTVTGVNPSATWTFQIDPAEASNTLYIIKSIPIGNLVGGAGKILLEIQDTSGFEDGFFFKVLNDGSSTITVDAQNGTGASHLIGPSSTSIFDPSTGFDLGEAVSAEFVLGNSGASTTIFRL